MIETSRNRIGRVYPRVCGGASATVGLGHRSRGLSPRVRGSRSLGGRPVQSAGSIPACAGEPPAWFSCCRTARVYPRVCGGAGSQRHQTTPAAGLSPRVRGSPCGRSFSAHMARSIPACAGEPVKYLTKVRLSSVFSLAAGVGSIRAAARVKSCQCPPHAR